MKRKYVRVTEKLLQYHSDWHSIFNESGKIIEETKTTVRIHILSNRKKHLNLIYIIPKDCVTPITNKKVITEML